MGRRCLANPSAEDHSKMKNEISCRPAQASDIERIKEILFAALHQYRIAITADYCVADIDGIGSAHFTGFVLVILRDAAVIGFSVLLPVDRDRIELKRLYLSAPERKKGLGRLLLRYAVDCAKEGGYKCIRLETTSIFKEAVALYRRNGFHEIADAVPAPAHDLVLEKRL